MLILRVEFISSKMNGKICQSYLRFVFSLHFSKGNHWKTPRKSIDGYEKNVAISKNNDVGGVNLPTKLFCMVADEGNSDLFLFYTKEIKK